MRLTKEPREGVENFGNKMSKMACQIRGTGSNPIDLLTLIYNSFIDYQVLDFHLKATWLYNLVDSRPKSLDADRIIRTLKTKLWSLKYQGLWSPAQINKV